jgi:hypothetical protein
LTRPPGGLYRRRVHPGREHRSHRPSPAFVLAAIALFVALGGSAAALSGSNTVFSDDIVNGQIKTADQKRGEIGTDASFYAGLPNSTISSTGFQKMFALTDQFGTGRLKVTSTRHVFVEATVHVATNGNPDDIGCKIQRAAVGHGFSDVPGEGVNGASMPGEYKPTAGFAETTIPLAITDQVGPGRWDYRVVCQSADANSSGEDGTLQAVVVR